MIRSGPDCPLVTAAKDWATSKVELAWKQQ